MITLEYGNSGPYVSMLQLALKRAGYQVSTDGSFDEDLLASVKKFQSANNITEDGIVGEQTWHLLEPYILGYKEVSNDRGEISYVPLGFDVVPTDIPYTYELVSYIVKGLTVRYPFLKSQSIGKSIMGNDILSISVGKGSKEIFYNAEHHANEWITTPLLLKFVEDYSRAYQLGESINNIPASDLFDRTILYLVPCVNPDGLNIVNGALPVGEYYNNALSISKNYPDIPFPNGWKANVRGVDLNLNYPANWNMAKEIKYSLGYTSPAPRDFVGTEPLSEPESLAIYNFTVAHNFLLTISYHTQGDVIYWRYLEYQPKNSYKIGRVLSEASGYPLELTPAQSSYAGYKDWYIQAYLRPGYTIEAGRGVSPLPLSQFDEIYKDNIGIMTAGLEMV